MPGCLKWALRSVLSHISLRGTRNRCFVEQTVAKVRNTVLVPLHLDAFIGQNLTFSHQISMQLKTSECFRAQFFPLGFVFAKTSAFWLGRILFRSGAERRLFPVRSDPFPLSRRAAALKWWRFGPPGPFPLRREQWRFGPSRPFPAQTRAIARFAPHA